jgi:hypothetical protein
MAIIDVPPSGEPPADPPSIEPAPPAPAPQKSNPLPKRPPKPPVSTTGNPKPARGRRPRPPTGSRRELAQRIVNNPRINLAKGHVSGVRDGTYPSAQLAAVARGEPAKRSAYQGAPGGTVPLDPGMLQAIEDLSGKFAFGISEIAGGSHGPGSYHYYGRAFDVNTINGLPVSAANPHYREFMREAARLGARGMLGPGDPGHDGHIHVTWPQTPASQIIADPKPSSRAKEARPERAEDQPAEPSVPVEPVSAVSETRRKLNDVVRRRLAEVVELEGVIKLNGRRVEDLEQLIETSTTGAMRTLNEAARRAVFEARWNSEANKLPNQTAHLKVRPRLNILPEIDHVEVDHF